MIEHDYIIMVQYITTCVTRFAKTFPNGTRTEI